MAGKRYSAGAIFLQVVPVFANVQRAIEDEAKNIDRALGGQMEKSGQRAGERAGEAATKAIKDKISKAGIDKELERQVQAGVADIDRALADINTKNLGKKLRSEVRDMRHELDTLSGVDLTIDDNLDKVRERIAATKAQIEDMRKRSKVFFDIKGLPEVYRAVTKIQAAIDDIDGTIELDVDTKGLERKMGTFERNFKRTTERAAKSLSGNLNKEVSKLGDELKYLQNLRIGLDISSTRARAELNEIRVAAERLSNDDIEIDTKVDVAAAMAELAAFEAALQKIEADDVNVDVNVDSDGLRKAARHGDDAANSFRSFNVILLAVVSAGPALIPILAGIAGGLIALGPAAAVGAAGLGSVLVGFSGIGDALTALGNQQDQAAMNAQSSANAQRAAARQIENAQDALSDARRNAARAAEDAAERVKEAREAAADAIEDALERQKDAQEEYRDAVEEVADAEQALRDAREDARKDAESLAKRQRQNAVDERQAVLDLFEAQSRYNAVMADGSATNTDREQASVNLEQAQIALNDTRDEQVALAEEAADYAKNGVEGSDKVKSAQDDLTAALEAQKDAQEAVKEAAEAADEARIEGAERVKEALEDQRETLSDNARAIQRAKENLADARRSAEDDLGAISAQANAVKSAFDKLGPAGETFALFLFSLRSGFYEFRDAIQTAMLPAIQEAIEGFVGSSNASKARDALVGLAAGFGQFVKALSQSFQGPAWAAFFEMLATTGPKIQEAYGQAFVKVMEAFASILVTTAPFALRFAEGVAAMAEAFADWAASKAGQEAITDFLDYVERIGPKVLDFFFGLGGALVNMAKAIAPYAEVVLGAVDSMLDFIAKMDTETLGTIMTGLTVILLSSQVVYAMQNLAKAGQAIFATALGPWVFLILAVAGALYYLYETNEDFRDFINDAWGRISKVIKKAWEQDIKPALEELWAALQDLWKEVLQPFLEWLGPILVWVIEHLLPVLAKVFAGRMRAIALLLREGIIPTFKGFGKIILWVWEKAKWAWDKMVAGARLLKEKTLALVDRIKDGWRAFGDDVGRVWREYIKPIWDTIKNDALPALKTKFEEIIGSIGTLWEGFKKLVGTPIKFIIEKVINDGIIAGYNKIAGWVGAPKLDDVPVPESLKSFATGGIMPGYTPGRDPHKFVSPTGGRLELSGGEAVMRPEWTQAMGSDYVYQMNALARRGGPAAVRKAMGMGSYWMGGILPLPSSSVSSHGSSYPFPAFDLNYPGYSDFGKQIVAFRDGIISAMRYLGDTSYGRYMTINHGGGVTTLYAHLSNFVDGLAEGMAVRGGAPIGYVGDIGNTGTPPTSHLHFEIRGGDPQADGIGDPGPKRRAIPGWLMGIVKDPLGAFKDWATGPLDSIRESVGDSPWLNAAAKAPLKLGEAITDKVWDVIPGWVKTAAGWAGEAAQWAVGGVKSAAGAIDDVYDAAGNAALGAAGAVKDGAGAVADFLGFANGGVLPYNGAMMYDSGGYLPPGMTTVVNLTGKPEPVFTDDQWGNISSGAGGENFTYAPTFQGSNLTAADVVDDLDFYRRKASREGRYQRSMT